MIHPHLTLNCGGTLLLVDQPIVMGIINTTPDSFYDKSRHLTQEQAIAQAANMLEQGASILDIGGASTRPSATDIPAEEEIKRVIPPLRAIKKTFSEAIISIDTFRSSVAEAAVNEGATIINDISGGSLDPLMYQTAGRLECPYILMHMRGTPATMQQLTDYGDVTMEVFDYFVQQIPKLRAEGVKDIIIDPGFGFAKTTEQNYELLTRLHVFKTLEYPLLAGISRKSMINRVLGTTPAEALNGTSALHMVALQQGARILRVHDVRPAIEVIKLWQMINKF